MSDTDTARQDRSLAWRYWPEIDGLRAIAVLSVLLFHLDRTLLRGGFVGVDVFFVISGFLITSILLGDIAQGRFTILRFYQRRIARIAPAALVVIATVVVAGRFVYSAQDFSSVGANAAAAALSLINIKLLSQGGYFQTPPDASPLLHFWSLAVEDQFYLLFPIYLLILLRFSTRPLTVTLTICGVSFLGCIAATSWNAPYAFYLLPTRAWELLAGAALAMLRRQRTLPRLLTGNVALWSGLVLLALSFVVINDGMAFPGWIAAWPVAATLLILGALDGPEGTLSRRLLAHPAMVFVGLRSYALYLWHWAVFSLVDYHFLFASGWLRATLKIAITAIATLLTYALIERPARAFLNAPSRRMTAYIGAGVAVALIATAGIEIRNRYFPNADPARLSSGGVTINPGGNGTVVLLGDSIAAMYGYELASLAQERGFRLHILAAYAVNELPGEAETRWPQIADFLARQKADVVVVAQAWSLKLPSDARPLREAIATIAATGARPIILTEPPVLPIDASRDGIRTGRHPPFFEISQTREKRSAAYNRVLSAAENSASVIDVSPTFAEPDGAVKAFDATGRFTYQDPRHLSDAGTRLVRPMLDKAIMDALSGQGTAKPAKP